MSASFLRSAFERAADLAVLTRPVPNDDALAALELHGPVLEISAGAGLWSGLLRARGLVDCACFDLNPPAHTYTDVQQGGLELIPQHADHTLLCVRGHAAVDHELQAISSYIAVGGTTVAYAGVPDASVARALESSYERVVTVQLPAAIDQLSFWRRAPSGAAAPTYGVLDVRLELVDLETPEWAAAPAPVEQPFTPVIGSRSIPLDRVMGGAAGAAG